MTCEEFQELAGAYVLDAITPEERREAQAHLSTCANCTRLVQELGGVVSVLHLAAPQVAPSPALKERIMRAILQISRPAPLQPRPQMRQPTRRRAGWTTRLLAVAALVLCLITGGMTAWNVSLQHQVSALQTSNKQLSGQLAQVYSIAGTDKAHTAAGSLYYLPQQKITVLVLHNLPKLQGTQIYQGWLLHNGTPVSVGVLSMQNGTATLAFPGTITGYDTAAVSQEPGPRPSARAPAGPIVATASLQQPAQVSFTI